MSANIHEELKALLPRLWRFCLSLTRQRAAAEDLLQNCCLRILERHHQFTAGTRFDQWAFRIAKNLWFNELRSQRVRDGVGFDQSGVDDLLAKDKGQDWMVLRAEVFKAVMELPEVQRVTMCLVYVEGFSYAETADILDIPQGTVMSRLAAGRRALKNLNDEPEKSQPVSSRSEITEESTKPELKPEAVPIQSTVTFGTQTGRTSLQRKRGGSTTLS